MNWDTVQQFLRIILQVVAGMLVSKGYLSQEMGVTMTGALLSLAGVAWWAYWNRGKAAAPSV